MQNMIHTTKDERDKHHDITANHNPDLHAMSAQHDPDSCMKKKPKLFQKTYDRKVLNLFLKICSVVNVNNKSKTC